VNAQTGPHQQATTYTYTYNFQRSSMSQKVSI
jgi:hypothetical protein